MIHTLKLKEIYFNKIKNGEKIYEIRLNDEKRQFIKLGDTIVFKKEPELLENLNTKVEDLIYFNSFQEMINNLDLRQIGFEKSSKQEVLDVYRSFYSQEKEQTYGVVAIKVALL